MKHPRRSWLRFAWLAPLCILGCDGRPEKPRPEGISIPATSVRLPPPHRDSNHSPQYAVDNSLPGIREPHVRKDSGITELLADKTSAYRASLTVDDDAIYLLTGAVAYRIVPGSTPQTIPIANGETAAVTRTDFVYWSKGSVWRIPKTGGTPRRLTPLALQPQFFLAAGDAFAWLTMVERDRFVLQTLEGRTVRTLLSLEGRIEVAAMEDSQVFFVKRDEGERWRIGRVSLRGGAPIYGASHDGPTPAKLAVANEVYYYDVKTSTVRRLPTDLSREETVTRDLVCSPIAVAVRIYCPNVEGMFEIARHAGAKIMPLFPSRERLTMVAASSKFLGWLSDPGPDRLSLKMIRLELDDAS
jgi:hypothetical protein